MTETGEQEKGEEEKERNQEDIAKKEQDNALSDKIVCKDNRGRSPIFNACEKNNLSALKLLVEAGFDPDEEDREGWRPIQAAITNQTGGKDMFGYWLNNQTGKKHDRWDNWINKEAEKCVFHLLSSSKEVRKRTQADDRMSIIGLVTISQGGTTTEDGSAG